MTTQQATDPGTPLYVVRMEDGSYLLLESILSVKPAELGNWADNLNELMGSAIKVEIKNVPASLLREEEGVLYMQAKVQVWPRPPAPPPGIIAK